MKKSRNILFLLLIIAIFNACGSLQVTVKPDANFSKNATLTIAKSEDETGTVGELNHLLFSKGFNIIAYSTAKKAIKYKDEIKGENSTNNEFEAEIYSIQELNSIYALELNYSYYYDMLYWAYNSFSARVIDLNTGEIIMSAYFRGDRSVHSVLSEFVERLSQQVK